MSSCIKDHNPCHYDGSLGYCCSSNCLQFEGQNFGTCMPKPTSQPSSTTPTSSSSSNPSCIKDNERCHYDGSLGYCCSGNCLHIAGQAFGACVAKPTTQPPTTSSTSSSLSCIEDNGRCHWNGSLGYCCSTNCLQLEGQPFGKCEPKATSRPSTSSSSSSCLGDKEQCKSDGSMGSCCSFNCQQLEGDAFGQCVGSSPPTVPAKCLNDGADCKSDGSFGFCCSKICDVIAPHTEGTCRIRPNQSSNNSWIIYVSVSMSVVVILAVLGFVWLYYRQRKLESKLSKDETEHFFKGNPEAISINGYAHEMVEDLPYNTDLEIAVSDFWINKDLQLGSGCFGLVLAGKVKGTDVAAKTIRNKTDSGSHLRSLLSEIKILQYIGKFDNIVSLVGCNTADLTNGNVYMFLEFCKLGSLENYLRTNKYHFSDSLKSETTSRTANERQYENSPGQKDEVALTHTDLLTWSLQITNAMRYLAGKKVIHADLATRNVLLLTKTCAKVTDFGLSRRLYDYSNYVKKQQEPLPWRWMAIESLQHLTFSHQSDVWSLGVTMWEVYSLGDIPYPGLSWTADFVSNLENNLRPNKPARASHELYDIMLDCWKPIADTRPTFEMIYKRLQTQMEALSNITAYTDVT
ncbi:Vascular endothelial growth factor receptor 3 [Orchesella cincta]|uniref:Vascular endothelial growth factor receptor 3 n=1 Tax=Orchesella cincta TaxID=48709 RepID=A0A1D2MUQ1_ORCCI|nr:Vascular endothelial growth factor receptor 3 [Orchesella cincta]